MNSKKNDRILMLFFVFLIIIILIISLLSILSLNKTNLLFEQAYKDSFIEWTLTEQANSNLIAVHRGMKDVALSRNQEQLEAALKDVDKYNAEIHRIFDAIAAMDPVNSMLQDVLKAYSDWEPIRAQTIEYAKNGQYEQAAERTRTIGIEQVSLITSKMQMLIEKEKAEAEAAYQTSESITSNSIFQFWGLSFITIVLASFIFIFVKKKILSYEQQLYREREELKITFDSIGDGVITTNLKGAITSLNRIAEQFTGWKSEDAVGKPVNQVFNIINATTGEKAKDPVEEVLITDKICQLENHTVLTSTDGIKRHIADNAAPIKDKNGKTIGVVITFRDVTEKKIAEKQLRDSEEKFRAIFQQASVGICITSLKGEFLRANQKCCEILGYSFEELSKLKFIDITYPDDKDISNAAAAKLLDGTINTMLFEKRYIRKDGTVIWANLSVSILRDSEERPISYITTIQDHTDRKLSEMARATSESRLKSAQTLAHVGSWELDLRNKQVWGSEEAMRILGYQGSPYLPLEVINNCIADEDRPKMFHAMRALLKSNEKYDVEFKIRSIGDNRERILRSHAIIEYDINGKSFKVSGTIQDITERKQAEEMLRKSEEKYKALYIEYEQKQSLLVSLINSIPDLIFYKDINSVYLGCNKAFEAFAGKKESELIGLTDYDLFDGEIAGFFRSMDTKMLEQGITQKNEESVTYPDGMKVLLETIKTPFYNSEKNVQGLIGISRDITERKKKEEEILYLSYHDVLTGLYNRGFFEREMKRLNTGRHLPLSVIMGDIAGLKLVNDGFGHKQGDKMLVETACILKRCCRDEDIIARIGGDEFCVLLPHTNLEQAQQICNRIRVLCEQGRDGADKDKIFPSLSLGYATKTKAGQSIEAVIRDAEAFMYKRKLLESKSTYSSLINSIKTTLFESSHETEQHAERLVELSHTLGQRFDLSEEQLNELGLLATLHDIGKMGIDDRILNKPGKLTEDEWTEMKKHPEIGYRIALASPELLPIANYILCHHEHWDGSGYPQGITKNAIPLLSRILAVVDAYDAMTNDRPYRNAMSKGAALMEINKHAGIQFDPDVVKQFIEMMLEKNR